jgi:hypothetical protein
MKDLEVTCSIFLSSDSFCSELLDWLCADGKFCSVETSVGNAVGSSSIEALGYELDLQLVVWYHALSAHNQFNNSPQKELQFKNIPEEATCCFNIPQQLNYYNSNKTIMSTVLCT